MQIARVVRMLDVRRATATSEYITRKCPKHFGWFVPRAEYQIRHLRQHFLYKNASGSENEIIVGVYAIGDNEFVAGFYDAIKIVHGCGNVLSIHFRRIRRFPIGAQTF